MEQFAGSNVSELVSKVQGVQYQRRGVDEITFNARGINSAFNIKVFQLVDNRNSMAAASGGVALFNNGSTNKDDIERIEIVLGPQSALYGPNAHNALFNYITKDPRKYPGTTIAVSAGSQYQFSSRFRYAAKINNRCAYKLTGGLSSRVFIRDSAIKLPLIQGKETTGANSIAVLDNYSRKGGRTMIVVGGDFNAPSWDTANCFYSTDRGKTWKAPKRPPHGYRSCVEYLSKDHVISCGINGVDYSFDAGRNWKMISKEGFNVCRIAKNGSAVFLAGNNGKIGKVVYAERKK
jgi:outer membrane receptor protein involved in Fe transport